MDNQNQFDTQQQPLQKSELSASHLITSDFHMPRAKAIATFVLGSRGIAFTPVSVPSDAPPESWLDILRDSGRALLWIVTGRTGASLNPRSSAL